MNKLFEDLEGESKTLEQIEQEYQELLNHPDFAELMNQTPEKNP